MSEAPIVSHTYMNAPHLLKLTIEDINTRAMYVEKSLLCWCIRLHIYMLDGNHRNTVADITILAKWFTHTDTITEQHQPNSIMHTKSSTVVVSCGRSGCTTCRVEMPALSHKMEFVAEIMFVFGVTFFYCIPHHGLWYTASHGHNGTLRLVSSQYFRLLRC